MAIRIEQQKLDNNIILTIHGRLTPEDTLKVSKKITSLKRKKFTHAVINLSELEYLYSH
jgi:anti-anti-sigma regulatory factor